MNKETVRVLLVDDHKIVRDGLRKLLDGTDGLEVCGEAADGREAVDRVRKDPPDIVVMDIGMAGLNGIEATRQIHQQNKSVRVVALSMHSDRQFVAQMLHAGAAAYLLKDCAVEELTSAIRSVLKGKIYLSAGITGVVVEDYVRQLETADSSPISVLTPKEREVLQLLAEGLATKEIAFRLHVSVKTIETHRKHVMEKLDLHSVAELTKLAVREGLTSLE